MKIKDIKSKLYDPESKIEDLLIIFRGVAIQSKNKDFILWIDNEINGYNEQKLPEYRMYQNSLFICKLRGFNFTKNDILATQLIKTKTDNEKDFIKTCQNVRLNHSMDEIVNYSKSNKNEVQLYSEQAFSYLIQKSYQGAVVESFYIPVNIAIFKKIITNVRMKLQDFIAKLEEDNETVIDDIFELNHKQISKTYIGCHIYENDGNVNIENQINNNGDDNKSKIVKNEGDIIKKCIEIVKDITENNDNDTLLKSEILKTLENCKNENITDKSGILKKIGQTLTVITATAADIATSLPLLTTLLSFLK
jgi:hypothetical protein